MIAQADFHAKRRGGLGASDLPALLGLSPWAKPFDLWEEKTGRREPRGGNTQTMRGHRLEPVAADWYAEVTGEKLAKVNRTVRDLRWPHLFCHPDRRVVGKRKGVEIKTSWREWDDLPLRVRAQVQAQLGLTGWDEIDVALMTFETLRIYPVARDDAEIEAMFEYAERWWTRHVDGDEPPIDGSDSAGRWLDRTAAENEMKATPIQEALAAELHRVREQQKALDDREGLLVNRIKESMVGAYALDGDAFRVTWKPHQRTSTGWKELAESFRRGLAERGVPADELDTLTGLHQATADVRPFVLRYHDEEGT